ncbi:hypothetical protein [Helicobacter cinaedi]|uniref:hypothetical protein n=3 Tax=Helicobacter cinaedi TaxID=213 RepID=UPI000D7C635B|nr:hypothetical protein [Helicobacter cinaedi]QOQ95409.1 hypothetical protein HW245_07005 [Helicobacter cinaedi]QOQ95454.1 hypothetical protein HW245_07295 [Helicobacter cinaedi]QOQ95467.1 hypothetical protein HW245_07370 [Helicobacter cinaedi]
MNPKDFIEQAKDYADIADASYAMLHYIDNNEEIDTFLDTMKANNPNPKVRPPARWIYADGIQLGYEVETLTEMSKNNDRQLGQPTAYALAIEARFSKDIKIFKPSENDSVKINNEIQSFIDRDKEDSKATQQKILVAINKSQQDANKDLTYHLSPRTKYFTSRFEMLHHQPNTSMSGYSHTLFQDTQAKDINDAYILSFRGTEIRGAELFKDIVLTDGSIAIGIAIPQIISLVKFKKEVLKTIEKDIKDSIYKLNVVGHSLGGHLAQAFCLCHKTEAIHKLYTFNAPGFGGILASLLNIAIRVIRLVGKLIVKCAKKLFNLLGFTRKIIDKCVHTCNPNDTLENYTEYADTLKQEIGEEEIENLAINAKKLSKAQTKIEVHHIETIKNPLPKEESFAREWKQTLEPSISVISDLGYKYGLNIIDKLDYKNTQRLHLLYVGELETSYVATSHFLESILQILYFYNYLLQSPSNQAKIQLSQSIEKALDYLNSYSKLLMELIYGNKLITNATTITKTSKNDNYLSVYQQEILHIFVHNPKKMAQRYEYDFNGKSEVIQMEDIKERVIKKELSKNDTMNTFLLLLALEIYTKIIDKNDMKCLLKGA